MTDKERLARTLQGIVVSNKMTDSIVVLIERRVKHLKYRKYIKRSTKVYAHDQGNTAKIGDVVVVKACRPISKTKCWVLVDIQGKAGAVR